MMAIKNLHLGQALESGEHQAKQKSAPSQNVPAEADLNTLVDDVGFSIRALHCFQQLDIKTLGDLLEKTEDELVHAKNFGHTSLIEVRKKLREYGLSINKSTDELSD